MSEPSIKSDVAALTPSELDTVHFPGEAQLLAVRSFGLTDPGKVRGSNQDQFLIATLLKALRIERTSLPVAHVQRSGDESHLFVVADGMGGHAGGEQASALAIDSVETFVLNTFKWFAQCKGREEDKVLHDFQSALGHANARVLAEASAHPELRRMGTTLTLAYSLNDVLFVAHVGDSRCYLHRGNTLHRLTHDHTLVAELVQRGALSAKAAAQHDWRHVVTNIVGGGQPEVRVELHKAYLEAGDSILLCSDGLTEMLADDAIAQIVETEPDPERACKRLVAKANDAGGRDNITVVLARYEAAPASNSL